MSEGLDIRRGRRFPPRITNEELNQRVDERMTECGAQNNLRAHYQLEAARVADALSGSRFPTLASNPKLAQDSRAWEGAFAAALAYLDAFRMRWTREALALEAHGRPLPEDRAVLGGRAAPEFAASLVRLALSAPERHAAFAEAVLDFAEPGRAKRAPAPPGAAPAQPRPAGAAAAQAKPPASPPRPAAAPTARPAAPPAGPQAKPGAAAAPAGSQGRPAAPQRPQPAAAQARPQARAPAPKPPAPKAAAPLRPPALVPQAKK
jgi:hypothetical protein